MPEVDIDLHLTPQQSEIFDYVGPARFHTIKKGRRFGFTYGAALKCIEWAIDGDGPILWGDTVHGNLTRYVERYFLPKLKGIPHHWRQQDKQLTICNTNIDLRSAEQPQNWEGFGYRKIILNEAGVIFQDPYLYTNAVLPMMMDYPDAELYAGGVPKGKVLKDGSEHPFYTLDKMGHGSSPLHRSLMYTSYQNPFLKEEDVALLENEIAAMSPQQVRQEIYGEFIDGVGGHLFAFAFDKAKHVRECHYTPGRVVQMIVDFNVEPFCATLWHIWHDAQGDHAWCWDEIGISGGTIEEMGLRLDVATHYTSLRELSGDRGGAAKRIGINSNASMYDDLARRLRLSQRQVILTPNPPHLKSREDCNYVFTHHPDFRIHPKCTGLIQDLQIVTVKDSGEIDKGTRTNVKMRADYLDCFVWDTPVVTSKGERSIANVRVGDKVWTRKGWQTVIDHWCRGEREVCEYTLSDGRTITCTPYHLFFTDHGWYPIRDVFLEKYQLCSLPSSTEASGSPSTLGSPISIAPKPRRGTVGRFIDRCGSTFMGLFPRATRSTTRTTTADTTTSPTSSASRAVNTRATTCESGCARTPNTSKGSPRRDKWRLQLGTLLPKASNGTDRTPSSAGSDTRPMVNGNVMSAEHSSQRTRPANGSVGIIARAPFVDDQGQTISTGSVYNVQAHSWSTDTLQASIADVVARNAHTGSVYVVSERVVGLRPVFDITVDRVAEFYANGVLVHNCARYAVNTYLRQWIERSRNEISRRSIIANGSSHRTAATVLHQDFARTQ